MRDLTKIDMSLNLWNAICFPAIIKTLKGAQIGKISEKALFQKMATKKLKSN